MKTFKSYLPILLATVGFVSLPTAASAISFKAMGDSYTDNVFRSELESNSFTELFVAESRIGLAGTGEKELKINGDVEDGAPVAEQTDFNWQNGQAVDFSLDYDGNAVTYTVGGVTLSSNAFSGNVNKIYLRTTGSGGNKQGTMSLTNLTFNGVSHSGLSSTGTSDGRDVDYLAITDISSPFRFTGTSTMSWTGNKPQRSHLAYQIKVGTSSTEEVPEPLTILGTVAALGFGVGFKKKHSQQKDN
ncbi:MAG: PEP-CTERM sorting domain-containing protein [Microcoleaceae cyanobacterium MO_207.B10]|nr:PEP-CTERM sorting domain-containing protein [Microcoleaceae cyanobacterium MO_207.B10]